MLKNPRRGRQARYFTTNVPKILDLELFSEQIFSENCRRVPLLISKLATPLFERYLGRSHREPWTGFTAACMCHKPLGFG